MGKKHFSFSNNSFNNCSNRIHLQKPASSIKRKIPISSFHNSSVTNSNRVIPVLSASSHQRHIQTSSFRNSFSTHKNRVFSNLPAQPVSHQDATAHSTATLIPLPLNPSSTSNLLPRPSLSSSPRNPERLITGISSANNQQPRRSLSGREMAHKDLRPRVPAANRLFSWRTPHGLTHNETLLEELPPQLVEIAKTSIMGAFAPSTRSIYSAGILRFNQFCDRWSIPESTRMPASHALLCAFIGSHKVSGRTIKSWLSGIRAFHLVNQAEWYGDNSWVHMARVSASKEGPRHKRPLRSPVSIEHLLVLHGALDMSNPFHVAVWAVALTTFFGCRHLGEIIFQ